MMGKLEVFTKKFYEAHIYYNGCHQDNKKLDELINIFLNEDASVELVSVHPLNKRPVGACTYNLEFLGVFKRKRI